MEVFAAPDPLVSEFWGHSPSVAEREPNAWDPQRAAEQITSAEWEARCRVADKGSKQQCRYKGVKEALGRLSAGSDETSGGGKAPQKNVVNQAKHWYGAVGVAVVSVFTILELKLCPVSSAARSPRPTKRPFWKGLKHMQRFRANAHPTVQ